MNVCLFLAALGLCCCTQAFPSCVRGLLILVASLVVEHRLQGVQASAVVVHGLSCCAACGVLLDQELNPCPLNFKQILNH